MYTDGETFWEVQDIIDAIHADSKQKCGHLFLAAAARLRNTCGVLQWTWEDEYQPSERSCQRSTRAVSEYTRQQSTLTSRALIIMCCENALHAGTNQLRLKWAALLRCLILQNLSLEHYTKAPERNPIRHGKPTR